MAVLHLDGGGLGLPRAVGAHDVHVERVGARLGGRERAGGLAGVGARREDRGAPLALGPGALVGPDVVVLEAGYLSNDVGREGNCIARNRHIRGDLNTPIAIAVLHGDSDHARGL